MSQTDWLTDWLTDCLTAWLTHWLTYWLTGWLTGWLNRLTDWLTDWLTHWLTHRQTDRQTVWLTNWLIDRLIDNQSVWLTTETMVGFKNWTQNDESPDYYECGFIPNCTKKSCDYLLIIHIQNFTLRVDVKLNRRFRTLTFHSLLKHCGVSRVCESRYCFWILKPSVKYYQVFLSSFCYTGMGWNTRLQFRLVIILRYEL